MIAGQRIKACLSCADWIKRGRRIARQTRIGKIADIYRQAKDLRRRARSQVVLGGEQIEGWKVVGEKRLSRGTWSVWIEDLRPVQIDFGHVEIVVVDRGGRRALHPDKIARILRHTKT